PWVRVCDAPAAQHLEHGVLVFGRGAGAVLIITDEMGFRLAGRLDVKAPRHAEVHDESFIRRKVCDEVFCAPLKAEHARACQTLCEAFRKRKAQVCPPRRDAPERTAFEQGGEPHADGFNLRQLRHALSSQYRAWELVTGVMQWDKACAASSGAANPTLPH